MLTGYHIVKNSTVLRSECLFINLAHVHRLVRAKGFFVNPDALADKKLSQELVLIKYLSFSSPVQGLLQFYCVSFVFINSHLIHACQYRWVQQKTVLFPEVVKVIFTYPIDRFSLCLHTVLKTHLEAFSFRDTFPKDSFAHQFITNLSKTVRIVIIAL